MLTHIVTGATGFVGGALVLELLRRTSDRVVAVVRATGGDPRDRLISSLAHAARTYGQDPARIPFGRVHAVVGDVARPGCGVEGPVGGDMFWHCAASLRYEDRYADEIAATNVDGTRHALDLARRAGAGVFNHVSTAYVSGSREGRIAEVPVDTSASQNHYERSKVAAEELSRAATDLHVRVFRPSIVVGHSETLGATTFSGLYGFVRQLVQYRGILERTQAGLSRRRRLRLRVTPEGPVDFVPVDAVARQAVHIGLRTESDGIYHLTGDGIPTIGSVIRDASLLVGFGEPEFVRDADELDWLDTQLDARVTFYAFYARGNRTFDRARTLAALAGAPELRPPVPNVAELIAWYLPQVEERRLQLAAAR